MNLGFSLMLMTFAPIQANNTTNSSPVPSPTPLSNCSNVFPPCSLVGQLVCNRQLILYSPVTQGGVDDKRLHASDHHDRLIVASLPLQPVVTSLGQLQPSAELLLVICLLNSEEHAVSDVDRLRLSDCRGSCRTPAVPAGPLLCS
ncbi:hypothetical protein J3F83DRAFT_740546 [Trichoderma novae-zelandiae]